MSEQTLSDSPVHILQPIDWGVAFALSHKRLLLSLALLPIAIEIFAAYLEFSMPLPRKQVFLIAVCTVGANALLISAVVMACIERVKGLPLRVSHLIRQAFRYLPKVFFSYVLLVSLILSSALVLPVLLLVLFFIWAPCFCVGEFYSKAPPLPDEEMEELFEADDESRLPVQTLFTSKSIWELGFSRSLQFAGKNVSVTFQLIILFWFANIVPMAFVDLFSSTHPDFLVRMFKILFSSAANVLVLAASAGAFLILLPHEAKEEIGVTKYVDPSEKGRGKRLRLQGRYSLYGVLVAVSFLGTFYALNHAKQAKSIPSSVLVELEEFHRENSTGRVTIRMTDRVDQFRWLNPKGIQLVFGAEGTFKFGQSVDVVGGIRSDSGSDLQPKEPQVEAKKPEPITPTRYLVLGENGSELSPDNFSPHYFPIKLVLYYDLPESSASDGAYSLKYTTPFGDHKTLVRGSYGNEW